MYLGHFDRCQAAVAPVKIGIVWEERDAFDAEPLSGQPVQRCFEMLPAGLLCLVQIGSVWNR